MEVPDEHRVEEVKVGGCFVKVMYGTRQVAWAWQEEVKKNDARSKLEPRSNVAVCFSSK